MSLFQPAYRVRLYAPRSVDATEATVLVPAAGAAHPDPFQVASIAGVSGYQPYLHDVVQGRRGRIDLKSRKLDVGNWTFTLIDKAITPGIGTNNLTRWWSAFWGDLKGKPMGRLRLEADETLDHGATWNRFVTGELVGTQLMPTINDIQLKVRDRTETLKMRIFGNQPHSSLTYIAQPTLIPIGFRNSDYGKLKKTSPFTGTTRDSINVAGVTYKPTGERCVEFDGGSGYHGLNLVSSNLRSAMAPHTAVFAPNNATMRTIITAVPNFTGRVRCHLKRLDTNAEGEFKVGLLVTAPDAFNFGTHHHVVGVCIKALETTDAGYLAVPATGVSVEVALYVDTDASDQLPLLINDVDPSTYIQDICAGKFGDVYRPPQTLPGGKSYGDPKRTVTTNGLASLVGTRPPMRVPQLGAKTAQEEIERVCFENNWAPWLDSQGRLNIVDLSLPTSLSGIATLTDTDLVADQSPSWDHDPTQAVQLVKITQYSETGYQINDLWRLPELFPTLPSLGAIEETQHLVEPLYIGSIDFGEEILAIDARGYRSMDGEQYQGQARSEYLQNKLVELANQFQRPFGYGLTSIRLRWRRTANVTSLTQGALALLNISPLPDPGTHKRGGTQLCRVLEYSEDGPEIILQLAFLAAATIATAPTLGAPAQETDNTWSGVTTAVTVNVSGHPVQVRFAVTDTATAVVPVDGSPLWTIAGTQKSTGTFTIKNVPVGTRIWVQGRSFPSSDATSLEMPSAWANAGGSGRIDSAALPTPSALSAVKTHLTATLSWTNGAADVGIEILLATPTGDPRVRVALPPPGSTSWTLTHLTPSTTYRAEVRHILGQWAGAGVTVDVTTDASGSACPNILQFQIIGAT